MDRLSDYVRYIQSTPAELDELYRDILIHVTGFFRDKAMFETLEKSVPSNLFCDRPENDPVRVWIPGCSTGEEVYSIAMTLFEYVWEHSKDIPAAGASAKTFQFFATDISDAALNRARAGVYTEAQIAAVSQERRKRFFVRTDSGYQVNKSVREMCVFAKHNIAKDPPFSNQDLISCRILLIYLGPALQDRVIPALHYALKPSGYLILGESESLGAFTEYFTPAGTKYKVYQRKKMAPSLTPHFGRFDFPLRKREGAKAAKE